MSHTNFLSWLLGAMFAFSVCLTSDLPAQETEKAPSTEQEKEDDSSEEEMQEEEEDAAEKQQELEEKRQKNEGQDDLRRSIKKYQPSPIATSTRFAIFANRQSKKG